MFIVVNEYGKKIPAASLQGTFRFTKNFILSRLKSLHNYLTNYDVG